MFNQITNLPPSPNPPNPPTHHHHHHHHHHHQNQIFVDFSSQLKEMIPKKKHPKSHLAALLLCSTGLSLQPCKVALDDFDHTNHAATGRGHTLPGFKIGWMRRFQVTKNAKKCKNELPYRENRVESCIALLWYFHVWRCFETMVEMCTPYAPSSSTTTMILSKGPLLLLRASYGALVCTSAAAFA